MNERMDAQQEGWEGGRLVNRTSEGSVFKKKNVVQFGVWWWRSERGIQ